MTAAFCAKIEKHMKYPKLKKWLGNNWTQQENPNCFTGNFLQALYIYNDHIKYWEDIRAGHLSVLHHIPQSKKELKSIIR